MKTIGYSRYGNIFMNITPNDNEKEFNMYIRNQSEEEARVTLP
jgi:hypothetical protein